MASSVSVPARRDSVETDDTALVSRPVGPSRFRRVARAAMLGTGELVLTLGVVVLLFAVYEFWGVTATVDAMQQEQTRQLEQQWQQQPPTVSSPVPQEPAANPSPSPRAQPAVGSDIAILSIPKLGKRWAVVEGVGLPQLRGNPGHYPNTAMPGDEGNFAVAGHRTQAFFWNLDQLARGDEILVQTSGGMFTYHVTNVVVVAPTALEVVGPVPPGEQAGRLLTLTTCNPKFFHYQRLIVHASLGG